MAIAETLMIQIQTDFSKASNDFKKLEGKVSKLKGKVDNSSTTFAGMGKLLKGAAVGGAIIFATKKVIDMGAAVTRLASDAVETQNKFNVTFSGIADRANKTATEIANKFNFAESTIKKMLASTGDLLAGFGFTQDSAFSLSKIVTELSQDLASFQNLSGGAEQASQALTKALLGERESIKTLGIAITEADISQLAEDKGIVGELTRQQKAFLTLELAVKQSKNAIGDNLKTQNQFAGASRIFAEQVKELGENLGDFFLPVIESALGTINKLLKKINTLFKLGKEEKKIDEKRLELAKELARLEDKRIETIRKRVTATEDLKAAMKLVNSEDEDLAAHAKQVLENNPALIESYSKEIKQIEKLIESKRDLGEREIDLLEKGKENLKNTKDNTKANKDNASSMEEILKLLNDLLGSYDNTSDSVNGLTKAMQISEDQTNRLKNAYKEKAAFLKEFIDRNKTFAEDLSENLLNIGKDFAVNFGMALSDFEEQSLSVFDVFRNSALDAISAVLQGLAQLAITEAGFAFGKGNFAKGFGMSAVAAGALTASGVVQGLKTSGGKAVEDGDIQELTGNPNINATSGQTNVFNIQGSLITEKEMFTKSDRYSRRLRRGF